MGVFFAFLSRDRGNQRCFVVCVSFISSWRATSGCLFLKALIAVCSAVSLITSELWVSTVCGSGFVCSYGNGVSGCQATMVLPFLVTATLSTRLLPPTGFLFTAFLVKFVENERQVVNKRADNILSSVTNSSSAECNTNRPAATKFQLTTFIDDWLRQP